MKGVDSRVIRTTRKCDVLLKRMNSMKPVCRWIALGITGAGMMAGVPAKAQNNYVNFEGKQTVPGRLSADGSRLLAGNTGAGGLSVFGVSYPSSPALRAEIPVGLEPPA